jgi:hypothetical protein
MPGFIAAIVSAKGDKSTWGFLTVWNSHHRIKSARIYGFSSLLLPPRSTAGQLTLDQHIGVRIPGGQPNQINNLRSCGFPGVP